ncbi:helix-turn-helix transcriptional regulator [Microbacterium foliorum]|uniref:Helix-turn-helix transcriptional regulator n=1 Tax=Microbacterium foliorum TaxID=104336 RepID=A0A4Y5YQ39_9MICO|nr:helix-turn-helix transcriptional regulator [Microbacterium foliorum]QDE34834.1 helix-turn-helix transcriptional regulator [Microbacterium foliorum]
MHDEAEVRKSDWDDFAREFAVRLRQVRHDAGLSQEDVAHRANLSRFIYRQYEQGESRRGSPSNPSLRAVLAIAQVFEIPLADLLPGSIPDLRRR